MRSLAARRIGPFQKIALAVSAAITHACYVCISCFLQALETSHSMVIANTDVSNTKISYGKSG